MSLNRTVVLGPILLLLGVLMLFHGKWHVDVGTIFTYFWPVMFVMPLGVFFHWMYFSILQRRGIGLLVPGGILCTAGVICQIAMLFDSWGIMWPGFILAVAVGLFELYWFGGRNKWLLIPINILTVLSALFFIIFSIGSFLNLLFSSQPLIAIVLLVAGMLMMLFRKRARYPF